MLILNASVLIGAAKASDHHYSQVTSNTYVNEKVATGLALSMGVAAIDCTYASKKWQGGVGMGFYDGIGAPVIGACKKFNNTLIKMTIGRENESTGGNIGFMFTFD